MKFLLPKEPAFYENFQQMSVCLSDITAIFRDFAADYKDFEGYWLRAKEVEHKADTIAHRVINLLNQSFMTPFDREDIYRLVHELDDIIDLLENTIHSIYLYEMSEKKDFVNEFAGFTAEATEKLNALIKECFEKQKYTDLDLAAHLRHPQPRGQGRPGLRKGAPEALRRGARPHQGHQVEGHPVHPRAHHGRLPEGQQHGRGHRRQERLTWRAGAWRSSPSSSSSPSPSISPTASTTRRTPWRRSSRPASSAPSRRSSGRPSSTSSPSSSSGRPWPTRSAPA